MTDAVTKRRAPILDGRLSAAMALAENCRCFADIGADHGRLSAVMLLADANRRALVADISPAALSKAKALLTRLGLDSRARFAVADGLTALDGSETPDTVFILGMGGETVSGILERGAERLDGAALILGAQTELPLLRVALCKIGYRIRREVVAHEGGRDYVLIRADRAQSGEAAYTQEELWLGPLLLRERPVEWAPVLRRRERLLSEAVSAMRQSALDKDRDRLAQFECELEAVRRALDAMRKDEKA